MPDICLGQPEVKFNLLILPGARGAEARLTMPTRLNYEHAPLRLCMEQLAERFQFSYWIDRRVDLDRPLTVNTTGSLRHCLAQLAAGCDAQVGLVENVITIAHPQHLAAMQHAAVRLHDQLMQGQVSNTNAAATSPTNPPGSSPSNSTGTSKVRTAQAAIKPLQWQMLTTPNELLTLINQRWQTNFPCELPHDLMNAGSLQACTLATQVTLLLGGFDQCAAGKQADQLRIVKLPPAARWRALYSSTLVNTDHTELLGLEFPTAQWERLDRQWQVTGETAAHLRLLQPTEPAEASSSLRPDRPRPDGPRSKTERQDALGSGRYTISRQADVPLGAVLNNLAQQLGLQLHWDEKLPPSAAHTKVVIEANNSKLDEILRNLGVQARLSITRQGAEVTVAAGPDQ